MDTIIVCFNIFPSDHFIKTIKEFYDYEDEDEVTDRDIAEYLENTIKPAQSNDPSYEVEGGDTDGWFIQSIERK